MHSTLLLISAILASLALAAPVSSSQGLVKRSFRVHHPGRPKRSARDAMIHVHRKYGAWQEVVWNIDSSSSGDQGAATNSSDGGSENGEVQAVPVPNQGAYISPVKIGNQQLNLDFDTGSSDLWVFSSSLPSSETQGHTVYDPSKSSSFVSYQGASWRTEYGDGSAAEGSVGFDTVDIGGATVQKQCVELADQIAGFQTFTESDGLLGLGFSNINTVKPQQQKTFWENVLPELDQPVFTADLDETASGSYDFGSIDTSKFTGNLQYAPVDSRQGYWMVDSNSNTIGGQERQCQACSPGVLDTGTTLMMIDGDVAEAYYNQVQGATRTSDGLYEYPCGSTLPDFGVAIGNAMITLKGSDLTIDSSGGSCIGGIQPMDPSVGLQIYGDVFFKQVFTVFDGGNTQVGVAQKA